MYPKRPPFHADVAIKQYSFLTKLVYNSGNAVLSELLACLANISEKTVCEIWRFSCV